MQSRLPDLKANKLFLDWKEQLCPCISVSDVNFWGPSVLSTAYPCWFWLSIYHDSLKALLKYALMDSSLWVFSSQFTLLKNPVDES